MKREGDGGSGEIRASPPEEAFSNDLLAAEWPSLFARHLTVLTLRDIYLLGSSSLSNLTPVFSRN